MRVSIITIVYNNKDHIENCIESILSQDFPNIEHIVIDGGSTDGTVNLIEKYKEKLAYFISEKDNGLYHALNKGVSVATGDVVGVLHSDDIFADNKSISSIVKVFNDTNNDVVYANGVFVDRDNISVVKRVYSSKPFKYKYLKWGWIPLHTSIFVKREVFDKVGLYNEKYNIAGDYDFSLRLFKRRDLKFQYLNRNIVKMRLGGKSTIAKLQNLKSREDLEIIRYHKFNGLITLAFKIGRKIPQYIWPIFIKYK